MKRTGVWLALGALCGGLVLATLAPRSVVDWRAVRAIGLESDDWGLAGFVPRADSWQGLDREALKPGRFPPVYWGSTLEDAAVVERMTSVLAAHVGRDGVPAVFQPNYVMGSLGYDEADGRWQSYELPHWPPEYPRPGLWRAVVQAQARGVWHPELHAALHYDPELRQSRGLESELARAVTGRGITLFPGSEQARELSPGRSAEAMTAELAHSLAVFARVFGRPAGSIIAPDYTWSGWHERLWQERGLSVIQAKREQLNPLWLSGMPGRIQKYLDRQWAKLTQFGRTYLERNCLLEPVQSDDAAAVVDRCLEDTRRAWRRGQPAIVETHRVNFAHTDPRIVATGLEALDDYLSAACLLDGGPVFLCDTEIAQLTRRGVSWRRSGGQLVLRNATHSARVLTLSVAELATCGLVGRQPVFILLAAGQVLRLDLSELKLRGNLS